MTIAELWKEFLAKHELQLSKLARERYRDAGTEWFSVFGSPMDFCEDCFLQTFHEKAVFTAHEKGAVLRLESDLDCGRSQLFSKMSVFESTLAAGDPKEAGDNNYWLIKMGSTTFEPWPNALSTSIDWCRTYPILNDYGKRVGPEPFHTLPIAFERSRFIIPDVPPPWAIDLIDEHYLPKVISSFGGSALCLDLDQATRWRGMHIANSSFLKKLETPPISPKAGRPNKQDAALVIYRQLFPNGHQGTLKAACQQGV